MANPPLSQLPVAANRPLRTLVLAMMTDPPIGGEFLRNWQNISLMQRFGPVAVFSLFDRPLTPTRVEGTDAWIHINLAAETGWRSRLELFYQWLRQWGLTYFCAERSTAAQALEHLLTTWQPDLVIIEQLWLYPYLKIVQRHPCRIIFDAHNVEAPLYAATKCAPATWRNDARVRLHMPQIQAAEQTLTQQADQVWVCSTPDQKQFQALYGPLSNCHVIPNGISYGHYANVRCQRGAIAAPITRENASSPAIDGPPPPPRGQPNILFLGNFAHLPNAEAAALLLTEILPQLRALEPRVILMLVGRQPTPLMKTFASQDFQVQVTDEVTDIRPYLAAASLMLVPLFQGSGTRLKILEAFAAGCPVISTAKGAEGLNVQDGHHLLIRNQVPDIVQAVFQLWNTPKLATKLIQNADHCLRSDYSWEAIAPTLTQAIQPLLAIAHHESRKTDH